MSAKAPLARPATAARARKVFIGARKQLNDSEQRWQYLFSVFDSTIVLCLHHRNRNGNSENKHDDSQRKAPRQRQIISNNHFNTDKAEHQSKPRSQINETVHQAREQEVKRP